MSDPMDNLVHTSLKLKEEKSNSFLIAKFSRLLTTEDSDSDVDLNLGPVHVFAPGAEVRGVFIEKGYKGRNIQDHLL